MVVSDVHLEYKTCEWDKRPRIGVYYVFRGFVDKGICKEFRADLHSFVEEGKREWAVLFEYEFVSELTLLHGFFRNEYQGIRTNLPDGVSFDDMSKVIAEVHFKSFFDKYDWLRKELN